MKEYKEQDSKEQRKENKKRERQERKRERIFYKEALKKEHRYGINADIGWDKLDNTAHLFPVNSSALFKSFKIYCTGLK